MQKASVMQVSVMKAESQRHRSIAAQDEARADSLAIVASRLARRRLRRRSSGCATSATRRRSTAIQNPTAAPGYKPVQMPMPAPQPAIYQPNSLWRTGSRAFFKDQRAHQVGDILTVKVKITDKAHDRERDPAQPQEQRGFRRRRLLRQPRLPITNTPVPPAASSPPTPPPRAKARARSTARKSCSPTSPRVVTQVLPNGNLVIEGKQEVRVNFEDPRTDRRRHRASGGHPERQHHRLHQDRGGAHRLWRPRPDHRRAAAALRPAGARRAAAVLAGTAIRSSPPLRSARAERRQRRGLRKLPSGGRALLPIGVAVEKLVRRSAFAATQVVGGSRPESTVSARAPASLPPLA